MKTNVLDASATAIPMRPQRNRWDLRSYLIDFRRCVILRQPSLSILKKAEEIREHQGEKREMAKKISAPKEAVTKVKETIKSGPAVRIEYPREGDVLQPLHYTFQIGTAPGAKGVEISIDHGDWKPCRESLGLWWFDWSDFSTGDHILTARTQISDDISAVSAPRRFTVA